MADKKVTFEIVANIGHAGKREVNLVSWNGRPAKVDIREWDEYHDTPKKGITMTDAEAKELYEALKVRYGE
jgi:hypothetical protein